MPPKKEHVERCEALAHRTGKPCRLPAGHGTNHKGEGRCGLHGGKSTGAPKGNKNAVVTGEFERLYYSALTHEEQHLYDSVDPGDAREQVESELRLVAVRQHRILIRIRRATELEERARDTDDHSAGMYIASVKKEDGWDRGKKKNLALEYLPILETILRLEDALTRVSALKIKYIDQLRGILKENPPNSGGLDAIVEAIDRSAQKIARRQEAEAALEEATAGVLD